MIQTDSYQNNYSGPAKYYMYHSVINPCVLAAVEGGGGGEQ